MHIPHTCSLDSFDREKDYCTPCNMSDLALTMARLTGLVFQAHIEFDVATGWTPKEDESLISVEEDPAVIRLEAAQDLAESLSQATIGATRILEQIPALAEHVVEYLTEGQREKFDQHMFRIRTVFAVPKDDDDEPPSGAAPPEGESMYGKLGYH